MIQSAMRTPPARRKEGQGKLQKINFARRLAPVNGRSGGRNWSALPRQPINQANRSMPRTFIEIIDWYIGEVTLHKRAADPSLKALDT